MTWQILLLKDRCWEIGFLNRKADAFSLMKHLKWWKVKVKLLSCVWLFATPWTIAYQAAPSMGFSRQEYWGGLPFPSPGDLPYPGIKPRSPSLQAEALLSEPPGKPPFASYLPQLLNCGVGENSWESLRLQGDPTSPF